MAHIKITKGLDIPIKGKPQGETKLLIPSGSSSPHVPKKIALELSEFTEEKFKLLCKVGDAVKMGTPLIEDRTIPGRVFVSPAGGMVSEIRRGLKRALLDIVIDVKEVEEVFSLPALSPWTASKEELIERLKQLGGFSHIRKRPFDLLADPRQTPRTIFVKAIESLPFVPSAELQVSGYEILFQAGLDVLKRLTSGKVHLIYRKNTSCSAFTQAKQVEHHTAEGPHPIANASLHIQEIDPISSLQDIIWTLNVHDVIVIGSIVNRGIYFIDRVIGIGGTGILDGQAGFYKVREGFPIEGLIQGRLLSEPLRLISGDPLMGHKVENEDFLGFNSFALTVLKENVEREFLHFFRLGSDKYSFSRAYISGHLDRSKNEFDFTTNLHGEKRAFIDSSLYDKVQPLPIPTMPLVKAVMSQDFDLAESLGFLEVAPEDFALPTFVDPSKMEMIDIIRQGQQSYAKENLA